MNRRVHGDKAASLILLCSKKRQCTPTEVLSTQDEMVGRERLGKLTWELKFLELQTFSKCKIIFIDSTCGFLALFSSHSGACSCLTIMFLNFVLSQHRTKTEQGPNSAWNLISLPENAQCLVQWFEQQWSGKDTLQSVELKTV